jgi:hypothetical protein
MTNLSVSLPIGPGELLVGGKSAWMKAFEPLSRLSTITGIPIPSANQLPISLTYEFSVTVVKI